MEIEKEVATHREAFNIAGGLRAADLICVVFGVREFDFAANHLTKVATDRDKSGPAGFGIDRGQKGIGIGVDIVGFCHTDGAGNVG